MEKGRVLVVDDKENILKLFEKILGESYELAIAEDGSRAIAELRAQSFDVVLSDISMPGADGFHVLKAVKAQSPDTEVILMTAFGSIERAVEAMKLGAYDYLTKPFDPDEVGLVVARAFERKRLRQQAASLRHALDESQGFHKLVGKSAPMRAVFELLDRAAASDATVLLSGETGTGKELAARAIHHRSARTNKSFAAINCGALPAELVESELFGSSTRAGLFEDALGGTLFLDEISELPIVVQVKLNRALQEREVRRAGETLPIPIDVRLIAATHRDLKAEVKAGRFREELFYRLYVLPIEMPALRARTEDIALLAGHFIEVHGRSKTPAIQGVDPDALRAMIGYAWPGNVRELENAIERAIAVTRGAQIELSDLPGEVRGPQDLAVPARTWVTLPYREVVERERTRVSRDYLTALMREFHGNVTRAAERAGMERESLHRLLRRYGVRGDDFKG